MTKQARSIQRLLEKRRAQKMVIDPELVGPLLRFASPKRCRRCSLSDYDFVSSVCIWMFSSGLTCFATGECLYCFLQRN